MAELFQDQNIIAFPQTLAPAKRFPVIGNRIFATLNDAQSYVDEVSRGTAVPGIILSVIADGANNGAYWVAQAAGYDGATKGLLNKIHEGDLDPQAIVKSLGYYPFDPANFNKENIKSTLGISNWALAKSKPSYTKSEVGLGNVTNLAASEYFSDLTTNATDAISATVGGTTLSITASKLKTSLGLKSLAYEDGLAFDDLTSHPTTLLGYGINGLNIIATLGYTPFDSANFTKGKIKSTLEISDWALMSERPLYSKADVGLGNVDNLAANKYFTALSSDATQAISITVGGVTKNITSIALKQSLSLKGLAYKDSISFGDLSSHPDTLNDYGITSENIIETLGYTPFNDASFTKENIKSKLAISNWALESEPPTYSKADVGLGNVDNIAAADYFTELVSNPTYPISITVGGTKRYIAALILKTSLGLKALAYKASLSFDDLTSHPTTLEGYGITDALGSEETAVAAEKLADDSTFTIWGNTFFSNGKPKSVTGNIALGATTTLKIGDATISWDPVNQMLKVDKGIYSEGQITAKKGA